ncbi:transcriptional regulator with XRE-family HTH domain [Paenibacillus cellulosilyticus]|uniref:Transcriptional regulator with XRE-family HTH domain n=1 Tax=Paenibacillus cellulosilyticus TaxID=375489 RepID=A0A2V2YGS3_9BACL|nr:helix-turn-helix transcriptional regulator [Paenibacillus cellulosilyticus]PWV90558.1 transcriptional regulator with XRE-family HTH domain [Paenibacillus cellulosilyticus]QKS46764.1 helix-turn-helix domain-containing protein [Paenibacillus cellulosilyticus]
MNHAARLAALSAFLKTQRSKLSPESVGLPVGTRRRTAGLRREEVAQLAGVSTTWYTWLEQGRDIQASPQVLDAVAGALQLTRDERSYLFSLAFDAGSGVNTISTARTEPVPELSPSLLHILKELRYCPTIVSDRRCRIVGWNEAAAHVFLDFGLVPVEERNMISLLFSRPELKRLAINWEHFASGYLAIFRSYYGQYVEDSWYEQFLREMSAQHPDFQPLWERSRVSTAPEVIIEFRHAKAGKMQFQLSSLQQHGETDLRLSVYTPAPASPTEDKLRKLINAPVI